MHCPSCSAENPPEVQFCEDCGAQLEKPGEGAVAVATREGPLAPGTVVAERFTVERLLEAGRLNSYEARDSEGGSVLLLEAPEGEAAALERQWEILSALEGESLWKPAERLENGGRPWLAGPWPGEETLQQRAASDPLAPEEVGLLGERLLGALMTLHEAGWLHRSLSPEAVWLAEDGLPVLTRFDRAGRAEEGSEEYAVVEGYSSPEAYGMQGGVVDERSDLFSLGAVLYYALTGEKRNLEERESWFTFPRPAGGGRLADVILKSVARDPAGRYGSAEEMLEALRKAMEPSEEGAEETPEEPVPAVSGFAAPAPGEGCRVAMKSHVGMVRSINQDACLELRLQAREKDVPIRAHLVVVADGMGGEAEGDKAASLAIRALAHEVVERFLGITMGKATSVLLPVQPGERNAEILRRGMERANRTIFQYAEQDPSRRGMGCTMTSVLLEGDLAVFGHVGDTRGYRMGETLDQVTTDHSLVGRLVQMGRLTREEARHSPQRSVIYRALGTNPEVEVDLYERRLQPGEYLLVSSDGVWEYYEDEELLSYFQGAPAPEEICERLVQTCLERGADDNATAAVVQLLGGSPG